MLLDLGRNDIGRVSDPGTVEVTKMMEVERFSHVMHLVSHVEGDLREDLTPYDALRSCFPAGTVSGAPKIRAMEIITEIEGERRGPYGGAVGYFSYSGNMDTALVLRTGVYKDGVMYVQAGGGHRRRQRGRRRVPGNPPQVQRPHARHRHGRNRLLKQFPSPM